ncbi:hypothetical protein CY34DRAFT_18614 [Suillus luteus UH-Slu-Lm8-n1]|uniref:Unplaced genomic scaffold CY34scaffold_902, whole genome shotgun sequence n=1 Tax=Suillus luteus UH-Slu-Lm8-n1 TaxID=930992 RepID=A0A0D0AM83_9AGAM|nr:hypothetical protein CY34DRAFT_18614 [Suillus luteus UH-Slu-Lm8-n1]
MAGSLGAQSRWLGAIQALSIWITVRANEFVKVRPERAGEQHVPVANYIFRGVRSAAGHEVHHAAEQVDNYWSLVLRLARLTRHARLAERVHIAYHRFPPDAVPQPPPVDLDIRDAHQGSVIKMDSDYSVHNCEVAELFSVSLWTSGTWIGTAGWNYSFSSFSGWLVSGARSGARSGWTKCSLIHLANSLEVSGLPVSAGGVFVWARRGADPILARSGTAGTGPVTP